MCSVKKNQNKKMENLKNVNVDICFMDKFKKRDSVLKIFETQGAAESVIFVEERMSADILASFLSECDYKSTSIHGARKRQQRIHALFEYNTKKMEALIMSRVDVKFGLYNYLFIYLILLINFINYFSIFNFQLQNTLFFMICRIA